MPEDNQNEYKPPEGIVGIGCAAFSIMGVLFAIFLMMAGASGGGSRQTKAIIIVSVFVLAGLSLPAWLYFRQFFPSKTETTEKTEPDPINKVALGGALLCAVIITLTALFAGPATNKSSRALRINEIRKQKFKNQKIEEENKKEKTRQKAAKEKQLKTERLQREEANEKVQLEYRKEKTRRSVEAPISPPEAP